MREEVTKERYVEYATKYFAVYHSNFHKDLKHFVADIERSIPRSLLVHYFDVVILKDGNIHEIVGIQEGTGELISNNVYKVDEFNGISTILEALEKMGYAEQVDRKWFIITEEIQ